jgi:hypothetical protein
MLELFLHDELDVLGGTGGHRVELTAIRITGARFDEDGAVSQLQCPQNLPKGTVGVEQVGSEVEEQLPLWGAVGTVTVVQLDVEGLHEHPPPL